MNLFSRTSSKIVIFLACFQAALPAQAIVIQIDWTGDEFGYSATGSFTFNDVDGDGFARSNNNFDNNEFTSFFISFFGPTNALLISYDLDDLQSFTNPIFNFNYDIANNLVLQFGNDDSLNGFALGNSQDTSPTPGGYLLNTTEGVGITFTSGDLNDFDTGGTVTAVPWETDVLPLMGATVLFGGAMWWKRKRAEKSLNAFKADNESVNN